MFSNLQIRPAKPHRRKPSLASRAGVVKRRVSHVSASASDVPSMSFMEGLFGEEFPEAFANGDGHVAKSRKSILDLPAELLEMVSEHLAKLDIKRLRLASKYLASHVELRIDRVYISPNVANLRCLRKILDHPRYRHNVRGIIWDDAQLEEYPDLESFRCAIHIDESQTRKDIELRLEEAVWGYDDNSPEYCALEHDDFFTDDRLTEVAKGLLLRCDDQFSRDVIARNATIMSIEDSYAIYQDLYAQEQEIMKCSQDSAAFREALQLLPNVRRITLTSEVWRPWNLTPHYDTPFFRSLPPGFRKPSVWPWLGPRPQATEAQLHQRKNQLRGGRHPLIPSEWHGYNTVLSVLAQLPNPQITEFIVDNGNEFTGISHQLFHGSALGHVLPRLPLTRLKLSLNSYYSITMSRSSLYLDPLHELLAHLQHLEHFDFSPNTQRRGERYVFERARNLVLDASVGKRLKTLALRNADYRQDQLVAVVEALQYAEHIILDNVNLLDMRWHQFFSQLITHYDYNDHVSKPRFTYIEPSITGGNGTLRSRLVEEEIVNHVYGKGESPFFDQDRMQLKPFVGWIMDDRDPNYKVRASEGGWAPVQRSSGWVGEM